MNEIRFSYNREQGGISMVQGVSVSHRFPRHAHQSLCAGLVSSGIWRITRAKTQTTVPSGSCFVIGPDEPHESEASNGCSYITICIKRSTLMAIALEINPDCTKLPQFTRNVVTDPVLATLIHQCAQSLNDDTSRIDRENAVSSLVGHILVHHTDTIKIDDEAQSTDLLTKARVYIDNHLTDDISLHDLALVSGLSPFYMTRQFTRVFGVPPHLYLLQSRIKHAQKELAAGKQIIDIALDCGFYDQSHFTKIFVRETGMTPGDFVHINKKR
jgi:AraC-like DNA-binding protein